MKTNPLKFMPYAQAFVRTYSDNSRELISYTTSVARVDRDGWLVINGLYSRSTIKHLKAFCREIMYVTMDIESLRTLVNQKLALNIYTGEVVDR